MSRAPGGGGARPRGCRGRRGSRRGCAAPGVPGAGCACAAGGRARPDPAPRVLASPAAVGTGTSLALSSLLSLLLFAGMQMYSRQLASTEWLTIQGGLLGSGLFVFSLTVSFLRWGEGEGTRRSAPSLGLPLTPSTRPSIIWRIWSSAKDSKPRSSLRVSENGGRVLQPSALTAPTGH